MTFLGLNVTDFELFYSNVHRLSTSCLWQLFSLRSRLTSLEKNRKNQIPSLRLPFQSTVIILKKIADRTRNRTVYHRTRNETSYQIDYALQVKVAIFGQRGIGKTRLNFCAFFTDQHADIFSANDSPRFQLLNDVIKSFLFTKSRVKLNKSRHPKKSNTTTGIISDIRAIECTIHLVKRW